MSQLDCGITKADLLEVLTEHRNLIAKDVKKLFEESNSDSLDKGRTYFDKELFEVKELVNSCISVAAKIPQEVQRSALRTISLGKRTIKQQQAALEIPGIDVVATKTLVTWALSLNICKGLSDDLDNALRQQMRVISESDRQSVLSRFLFAIQGTEKKALHSSTLGRECSSMVKNVILRLFWSARRGSFFNKDITAPNVSNDGKDNLPDWLAREALRAARFVMQDPCFGPKNADGATIENYDAANVKWLEESLTSVQLKASLRKEKAFLADSIARSVSSIESYKKQSSPSKRQKNSEQSEFEHMEDLFHEAVSSTRTVIINQLTEGRAKARESALKLFGFILEGMQGLPDMSPADFSINLSGMSQREQDMHRRKESLELAIGEADVCTMDMAEEEIKNVDRENARKLRALSTAFPSLSVKISYKVKHRVNEDSQNNATYRRSSTDGSQEGMERNQNVEWTIMETVSLHKSALNFLYEGLRAPTTAVLLRSCKESLKAVHTLALGFRGLILRTLGRNLSSIERNILGEVYLNEKCWADGLRGSEEENPAVSGSGHGKRAYLFVGERSKLRDKISKRISVTRKEYEEYVASQETQRTGAGTSNAEVADTRMEDRCNEYNENEDVDEDIFPTM